MLKAGEEMWPEVQEEMTRSLATMRVDYDQVHIKSLEQTNNPLLDKRRRKAVKGAQVGAEWSTRSLTLWRLPLLNCSTLTKIFSYFLCILKIAKQFTVLCEQGLIRWKESHFNSCHPSQRRIDHSVFYNIFSFFLPLCERQETLNIVLPPSSCWYDTFWCTSPSRV